MNKTEKLMQRLRKQRQSNGGREMIITPQNCTHFIEKNFKKNLNKTCELKGRCQLISDKASCRAYVYKKGE